MFRLPDDAVISDGLLKRLSMTFPASEVTNEIRLGGERNSLGS